MSKKNKKGNNIELSSEAAKVASEVADLLEKSYKMKKAEDKKEEELKEDKKEEELKEDEKEEGVLEKQDLADGIEGEIPPSSEIEESNEECSVDLKGMSPEQILALAAQALDELESRGVLPERSQEDIDAAEHELNEVKEDMNEAPMNQEPEMEKVANMAPPVPALDATMAASPNLPLPIDSTPMPMAMSLDEVLGKKDLSQLESLCAALNNHIATRKEMEKTASAPSSIPSAVSGSNSDKTSMMMKSMVSEIVKEVKVSLLDSLKKETSELKKSVKGVEDLVKSHKASMSTPSRASVAATSEKTESDELVKSNTESIVNEASFSDDVLNLQYEKSLALSRVDTLQKSYKGPKISFFDYVSKIKKAPNTVEIVKALNDLEGRVSK